MDTGTVTFYQEPDGDFLCVAQTEVGQAFNEHTARATNIEGMPESMATCTVVDAYLANCQQVSINDIPVDWIKWMYLY